MDSVSLLFINGKLCWLILEIIDFELSIFGKYNLNYVNFQISKLFAFDVYIYKAKQLFVWGEIYNQLKSKNEIVLMLT